MNIKKFFTLLLLSFILSGFSQEPTDNNKQEHQFDFWIGEWNVYKFNTDTIVGMSTIKPILNHKSIEENYQSLKYKYRGKSLNTYSSENKKWEQFYVDNSGLRLYMTGAHKDNKMVLTDCSSKEKCNRIIWTKMNDASVRQEWEQSKDKGKTWNKVFDGHYKLRK